MDSWESLASIDLYPAFFLDHFVNIILYTRKSTTSRFTNKNLFFPTMRSIDQSMIRFFGNPLNFRGL